MSHVYIITHFVYDFFFVEFTILMKNFPGSKKKKKRNSIISMVVLKTRASKTLLLDTTADS